MLIRGKTNGSGGNEGSEAGKGGRNRGKASETVEIELVWWKSGVCGGNPISAVEIKGK
ncbi:hypothetical protein ACE4RR_17520 [Alteribacillus sp. HJP-4]